MQLLFNQLYSKISESDNILLVSHRNPDPDTIGSALALGGFIKKLGKNISYFCIDIPSNNFLFLEGVERFLNNEEIFDDNYDLVIFLDCSDLSRCGIENIEKYKKSFWVSIDHHIDIEEDLDILLRDGTASATCEIVYNFLKFVNAEIDRSIATALLAGLMVDTNFLSNLATNKKSIHIAERLTSKGADYRAILKNFYINKNEEVLQIWGKVLSRLKHNKEKDLVTTVIFKDDLSSDKSVLEAVEGLSNFLNFTIKANIIMVLKEVSGGVKGSLRSNSPDIDVSKIAENYGGGGHRRAAGFFYEGNIIEDENEWRVEKK